MYLQSDDSGEIGYYTIDIPAFSVPGDYDGDGQVGPTDLAVWQLTFGQAVTPSTSADGNGNGLVDGDDFILWQRNHVATASSVQAGKLIPEPTSMVLTLGSLFGMAMTRRGGSGTSFRRAA